jgi:hypothetical protein
MNGISLARHNGTPAPLRHEAGLGPHSPTKIRENKYPNNVVQRDHRAIMRRTRTTLRFKNFRRARLLLSGFGAHHLAGVACEVMTRYPELKVEIDVSHASIDLFAQNYDIVFSAQDQLSSFHRPVS